MTNQTQTRIANWFVWCLYLTTYHSSGYLSKTISCYFLFVGSIVQTSYHIVCSFAFGIQPDGLRTAPSDWVFGPPTAHHCFQLLVRGTYTPLGVSTIPQMVKRCLLNLRAVLRRRLCQHRTGSASIWRRTLRYHTDHTDRRGHRANAR